MEEPFMNTSLESRTNALDSEQFAKLLKSIFIRMTLAFSVSHTAIATMLAVVFAALKEDNLGSYQTAFLKYKEEIIVLNSL